MIDRATPVPSSVMTTVAPCRAAPLSSETLPLTMASTLWLRPSVGQSTTNEAHRRRILQYTDGRARATQAITLATVPARLTHAASGGARHVRRFGLSVTCA